MAETADSLRCRFTQEELAELEGHRITRADGSTPDALELAAGWAAYVEKFDLDRALPWTDRSVWNEHDLAGALFLRDSLEAATDLLSAALAAKVRGMVEPADTRYRDFTVPDTGERMATIAEVDGVDRGWWWFRVPSSGPIAEDLARYS